MKNLLFLSFVLTVVLVSCSRPRYLVVAQPSTASNVVYAQHGQQRVVRQVVPQQRRMVSGHVAVSVQSGGYVYSQQPRVVNGQVINQQTPQRRVMVSGQVMIQNGYPVQQYYPQQRMIYPQQPIYQQRPVYYPQQGGYYPPQYYYNQPAPAWYYTR